MTTDELEVLKDEMRNTLLAYVKRVINGEATSDKEIEALPEVAKVLYNCLFFR